MAEWFSSFASQAMKFADDIADSLVVQANEAQAQLQEEKLKLEREEEHRQLIVNGRHLLPWETTVEARQILTKALMETIMGLSVHEKNFIVRAGNADDVNFSFEDFVPTALKLLDLDGNLARMHAKLSPKMNEEIFWFNYFCRIVYLRAISGIDGNEAQKTAEKYKKEDIIFDSDVALDTVPVHMHSSNKNSVDQAGTSNSTSNHTRSGTPSNSSTYSNISNQNNTPNTTANNINNNNKSNANTGVKSQTDKELEDELDLNDLNLDDIDDDLKDLELLDELNDIDPSDYEKINSSECNDELDAQIAQELAEMK